MTPREVIAKAIAASDKGHDVWDALGVGEVDMYLDMADAVIDALAGMEVTTAMYMSWADAHSDEGIPGLECQAQWTAMVGAMKHE